jgi:hypothetical protein
MGVLSRTIDDLAARAELRSDHRYRFIIKIVFVFCLLTLPLWMSALFFSSPWDYAYLASMLWVPLMLVVCALGFNRVSHGDSYLRDLLGAATLARLAFTGLYIWMGFYLYDAGVDAFHYWTMGKRIINSYSFIGWAAFAPPYWSSNLINNLCGLIMMVTRDALPALFLMFALAALWGGYFFYRAFEVSFPQGDKKAFGLLAVLLPSILFWSSAIGKDALAQLFIGIACYGYSKWSRNPKGSAAAICIFGIGGMLAVRPHIAAMLAVAMAMPYTLGRTHEGWMGKSAKIVILPLVLASTFMLVRQAGKFVGVESGDTQTDIKRADALTKETQIGGSAFNEGGTLPVRLAEAPFMMFRPFPWEIRNVTTAVSSVEAGGLLIFCWRRRREFREVARQWRRPYVGFLMGYTVLFSIAFAAATSNFGILVRQRIMMVPIFLMLFCAVKARTRYPAGRRVRGNPWLRAPAPRAERV